MPLFVSVMRIQLFTPVVTHIYLIIYFSLFTAILLAGLLIITLLCVQNCPIKILKKANGDYPAVHLIILTAFVITTATNVRKSAPQAPLNV